jgi:DNA invertase Pin-like site-specific DNA recombinase
MQRAEAGIRSLAEPFLDTTSDFAEIIFAILGVAAKLERRRILERTARGRADAKEKGSNSAASRPSRSTSRKRPANAAKRRPQLQRQSEHDFKALKLIRIKDDGRVPYLRCIR